MLSLRIRCTTYFFILALIPWITPNSHAQESTPSSGLSSKEAQTESINASARWWTLTDAITPDQLRAIHADTAMHQKRFRATLETTDQPALKSLDSDRLEFFVDGSTHPELFEMWLAFDAFAVKYGTDAEERRQSLARFGLHDEELETLVTFFDEYYLERQSRSRELSAKMKPMVDLARQARKQMSEQRYVLAMRTHDAKMLSDATGEDLRRVEELLALSKADPLRELAIESLPILKETLEPGAWQRFRRYLLEVQASGMLRVDAAAYRNKKIEGS